MDDDPRRGLPTARERINKEWEWLLEQLGLPEDYFLAVAEAIRQGR
jgi:hypothetical protein